VDLLAAWGAGPTVLLALAIGYLLGGIPSGFALGRIVYGMDIREHGSGNIGFTNVFRVLGFTPGVLVLAADITKGWIAVGLGVLLVSGAEGVVAQTVPVVAGAAAIVGHSFSYVLRLKGGKGVATAAGVILALMPFVVLIVTAVWAALLLGSRFMSIASIGAALSFPIAALLTTRSDPELVFALLVSLLVIARHYPNMKRLFDGTEPKFEFKRSENSSDKSRMHSEDSSG